MATFMKAEKKQAKLRLAITGPSGSGKTFSALAIAKGIGKRIAVIDTENHSASLYADDFSFDTLEIDPPYTIAKYVEAIKAAVDAGYDVLVIDSISHAWAGEGGLLDKKSAIDARGGSPFGNWAGISKEHEQFKATLLNCDIHLIVTMRSKQDYVVSENDKGKAAPKKIGLAPIQRDGMEYEFTLVLDMGMDHNALVSKTRVRAFDGKMFQPSKETGEQLYAWLMDGKPQDKMTWPMPMAVGDDATHPKPAQPTVVHNVFKPITEPQRKRLYAIWKTAGKTDEDVKTYIKAQYGFESTKDITMNVYEDICNWAEKGPGNEPPQA